MVGFSAAARVVASALFMGASCTTGPCVSVHTDPTTHQIIITATQKTPGSTSTPKPVVPASAPAKSSPAKPVPAEPASAPVAKVTQPALLPVLPLPTKTPVAKSSPPRIYKPRPYVYRYRPRPKKTTAPATITIAAVNLSDQISQLLPGNHLLYQPVLDPLSGVPLYFWSDAGNIFNLATAILGIGVNVSLAPSFTWKFGDGTGMTVNSPGGPYPNNTVTHIYSQPGSYDVDLDISWAGSWISQGVIAPVLGGAIVQTLSAEIVVAPGPTEFTG